MTVKKYDADETKRNSAGPVGSLLISRPIVNKPVMKTGGEQPNLPALDNIGL
jgi:hypothetical protein